MRGVSRYAAKEVQNENFSRGSASATALFQFFNHEALKTAAAPTAAPERRREGRHLAKSSGTTSTGRSPRIRREAIRKFLRQNATRKFLRHNAISLRHKAISKGRKETTSSRAIDCPAYKLADRLRLKRNPKEKHEADHKKSSARKEMKTTKEFTYTEPMPNFP